jgi:hypothetical protein
MTLAKGSAAATGRLLTVVTAVVVWASCGGGSSSPPSISTGTGSSPTPNTASVTVGFGALGPSGGYVNGIWTSVTVCAPGSTTNCQTIPNVLVDTGSIGLRLLSSSLTISLPNVSTNGNVLQECYQFADFSYVWGPVALAAIQIPGTGEAAVQVTGAAANSGVPIQIIPASPSFAVPSSCLATAPSPGLVVDLNTVESLGANGILGIGLFAQDCGSACVTSASVDLYCTCPGGQCAGIAVPVAQQLWNPVSAFSSSDTNGVVINLPSVGAGGAASVAGSLIFGIGTQSDNSIGAAKVYEVDQYGNFPQVAYNGTVFLSPNNGGFIDSGSNAIYFSDAASLASTGIIECGDNPGYYCPAATVPFNVTVSGANSVQGTVSFSIANADSLFNTGLAAFSNLGGDSGTGASTDYVDLGLPFFFGRTVFFGIAGASPIYPNGYWAF